MRTTRCVLHCIPLSKLFSDSASVSTYFFFLPPSVASCENVQETLWFYICCYFSHFTPLLLLALFKMPSAYSPHTFFFQFHHSFSLNPCFSRILSMVPNVSTAGVTIDQTRPCLQLYFIIYFLSILLPTMQCCRFIQLFLLSTFAFYTAHLLSYTSDKSSDEMMKARLESSLGKMKFVSLFRPC